MRSVSMPSFLSLFLVCIAPLTASWHPKDLPQHSENSEKFQDSKWLKLKTKVLKQLQNSWCTEEKTSLLMELTLLIKPEVCVEIGAFTGSSVLPVAATLQYLGQGKIFAVDAWSANEAVKDLDPTDPNTQWWSGLKMNDLKLQCQSLITTWKLNRFCSLVHATSQEASSRFDKIDFLHLDGTFSEQGALKDAQLYLPKVKTGGYILFSNIFIEIGHRHPKMAALWELLDHCEIICEIENNNAILFRKI